MVLEYFPKTSTRPGLPKTLFTINTIYKSLTITYTLSSIYYIFSLLKTRKFSKSNFLIKKNISKINFLSLSGISIYYYYQINFENKKIENFVKKFQNNKILNFCDNYMTLGFLTGSTLSIFNTNFKFFRCLNFGGFFFFWLFLCNEIGLHYFGMNICKDDINKKFKDFKK